MMPSTEEHNSAMHRHKQRLQLSPPTPCCFFPYTARPPTSYLVVALPKSHRRRQILQASTLRCTLPYAARPPAVDTSQTSLHRCRRACRYGRTNDDFGLENNRLG